MPKCENCEAHVTEQYVKVFGVDGRLEVCPWCPDRMRDGAGWRPARSQRSGRTGAVERDNRGRIVGSGDVE